MSQGILKSANKSTTRDAHQLSYKKACIPAVPKKTLQFLSNSISFNAVIGKVYLQPSSFIIQKLWSRKCDTDA